MGRTSIVPTCGRIVWVFSDHHWTGARPGIVIAADAQAQPNPTITVRVFLDPTTDQHSERTFCDIPIFDPGPSACTANDNPSPGIWAEWMPFQKGQAAMTEKIASAAGLLPSAGCGAPCRRINTHKVNECNDQIDIEVQDAPGSGGAHHKYLLSVGGVPQTLISFQNGPIKEAGVNGVSQEALLAIVRDRLECFQAGPFACDENQQALEAVKAAMGYLHSRTRARLARGVEGTHTV